MLGFSDAAVVRRRGRQRGQTNAEQPQAPSSRWLPQRKQKGIILSATLLVAAYTAHVTGCLFHTDYLLPSIILQAIQSGRFSVPPSRPPKGTVSAVYVEPGCHSGAPVVLRQALFHLGPNCSIAVWHSGQNEAYMKGLLELDVSLRSAHAEGQIELHRFNPADYGHLNWRDIYQGSFWYQGLITSKFFWEKIETPWMINLQSDTLICKAPTMDMFEGTTFVGGMSGFVSQFNDRGDFFGTARFKVERNPSPNKTVQSHMNGGFSIHNVSWSIDCINAFAAGKDKKWVEDDLWNFCAVFLNTSEPVTEVRAYSAASDNGVTKCFSFSGREVCPFGVHKPWMKRESGRYSELVANCAGLDMLESMQSRQEGDTCIFYGLDNLTTEFECNCTGFALPD